MLIIKDSDFISFFYFLYYLQTIHVYFLTAVTALLDSLAFLWKSKMIEFKEIAEKDKYIFWFHSAYFPPSLIVNFALINGLIMQK